MSKEKDIYHSLKVIDEICIGCTLCMTVCPTSAIRIKKGKARIYNDKCIDCGMCLKECPHQAIIVNQDDFNQIYRYKYRVALIPTILIGQFSKNLAEEKILSLIKDIGFTHYFEVDNVVDLLIEETQKYQNKHKQTRPLISAFCPAIVRLIQTRFPSLIDNIVRLKPAIDIAAMYYRKKLQNRGIKDEDIGVFYVTPCAAKIAAIKNSDNNNINGVINMDFIYNKIRLSLENEDNPYDTSESKEITLSHSGYNWSLTNGEIHHFNGRCLAIDEIHNVMEFLEALENEQIINVDYLELRACDESCASGVLTTENRFVSTERIRTRSELNPKKDQRSDELIELHYLKQYLIDNIKSEKVEAKPTMQLDEDMFEALKKMEKVQKILKVLPQIDCGVCGAPRCKDLAIDIVKGKAKTIQCIFIQRNILREHLMDNSDTFDITDKVWGIDSEEKSNKKKKK